MEQVRRNSANKTTKLIVTAHSVILCVHVVDGVFSDRPWARNTQFLHILGPWPELNHLYWALHIQTHFSHFVCLKTNPLPKRACIMYLFTRTKKKKKCLNLRGNEFSYFANQSSAHWTCLVFSVKNPAKTCIFLNVFSARLVSNHMQTRVNKLLKKKKPPYL